MVHFGEPVTLRKLGKYYIATRGVSTEPLMISDYTGYGQDNDQGECLPTQYIQAKWNRIMCINSRNDGKVQSMIMCCIVNGKRLFKRTCYELRESSKRENIQACLSSHTQCSNQFCLTIRLKALKSSISLNPLSPAVIEPSTILVHGRIDKGLEVGI